MSGVKTNEPALIALAGVGRTYTAGAVQVPALLDVNLEIQAGEMVALVGASGSGKSTLMNLLGCLDVPSQGELRIDGVAVNTLSLDELAGLRRERFGFIFQRYHLINEHDALANVTMPALYAGVPASQRQARATALLTRLGLSDRLTHRPPELSGGQQQRVSIARALMNGGQIILADEPTGALDSRNGRDMVDLLKGLHQRGHTVIIVTHDPAVAEQAPRVIKLEDGRLVSDSGWPAGLSRPSFSPEAEGLLPSQTHKLRAASQAWDAMRMACVALFRHRLRTALSTVGIGVGIAAVVGVMALGDAMRTSMEATLRGFLSHKLMVMAGSPGAGAAKTFSEDDVRALSELRTVKSVRPQYETYATARHGQRSEDLLVMGLAPADISAEGYALKHGRGLTDLDRQARHQVVVLTPPTVQKFFPDADNPIGQTMMLGALPFEVIGVTGNASSGNTAANWQATAIVPDTTLVVKLLGHKEVTRLFVYMAEGADPRTVQEGVTRVLARQHGQTDFTVYNQEEQFRQASQATDTMRWVLTAIASISLLVGGVGVMNMMLVAVSERTAEIGIRMAVGARPGDVQAQFLIEAVVLCGVGGLLGLGLSGCVIGAMNAFNPDLPATLSGLGVCLAFAVSSTIGLCFGYLPARQAARLSPVAALARE